MTRDLLLELALVFERDAEVAASGELRQFFIVNGRRFPSTFEAGHRPDFDEADRLDAITDELRERAEGRAA